ncbi:late histone H1-like [Ylistrum balloti]|uniref:late histone H1-like n=1 Tax=Ylistrum balloti TaxID=509963 RepID=UPI00290598E9|nr:late histone H1-like [Ylistrum balloti]
MSAATPKVKVKKASKPKKPATHPTYSEMVRAAITAMKERGGSSRQKIKKYISANYKVNEDKLSSGVKLAIKKGVASKSLVQVKGSFKLAAGEKTKTKTKKAKKPTKPKVKKVTKTKKTGEKKTKPAAKKPKKPKTPKKKTAKSPAKKSAKPKTVKKSPKKAAKKPAAKKAAKKPAAKK